MYSKRVSPYEAEYSKSIERQSLERCSAITSSSSAMTNAVMVLGLGFFFWNERQDTLENKHFVDVVRFYNFILRNSLNIRREGEVFWNF